MPSHNDAREAYNSFLNLGLPGPDAYTAGLNFLYSGRKLEEMNPAFKKVVKPVVAQEQPYGMELYS